MSRKAILLCLLIPYLLWNAFFMMEVVSVQEAFANGSFLLLAVQFVLPLPLMALSYFRAKKHFRCPNCQADFSLNRVQSVGYPIYRCSNCDQRHYVRHPRTGGGGDGGGGP